MPVPSCICKSFSCTCNAPSLQCTFYAPFKRISATPSLRAKPSLRSLDFEFYFMHINRHNHACSWYLATEESCKNFSWSELASPHPRNDEEMHMSLLQLLSSEINLLLARQSFVGSSLFSSVVLSHVMHMIPNKRENHIHVNFVPLCHPHKKRYAKAAFRASPPPRNFFLHTSFYWSKAYANFAWNLWTLEGLRNIWNFWFVGLYTHWYTGNVNWNVTLRVTAATGPLTHFWQRSPWHKF